MNEFWEKLYSRRGAGMKYELDRIESFLKETGNPEKNFKAVHVVGTNGKGSTVSFLSSMISGLNYRTGCFRSPHLYSPLERISIDNKFIKEDTLKSLYYELEESVARYELTFFEIFTALAFHHFSRENCDYAVIEAGLGGRLDATNTLKSTQAAVITNISKDHVRILGDSIEKITREKMMVIKPGSHVFLGKQNHSFISTIIEKHCQEKRAIFHHHESELNFHITRSTLEGSDFYLKNNPEETYSIALPGPWQAENAALALYAVKTLFPQAHYNKIKEGLKKGFWPGRLEKINTQPEIFTDVSHNPDGLLKTLKFIKSQENHLKKPIKIVFSALARKNTEEMKKLFTNFQYPLSLVPIEYEEGMDYETLKERFDPLPENWKIHDKFDPVELFQDPYSYFIMGSHYLLSETVPLIRAYFQQPR